MNGPQFGGHVNGIHERRYHETNNYRLVLDFLLNRDRYAKALNLPPIEME